MNKTKGHLGTVFMLIFMMITTLSFSAMAYLYSLPVNAIVYALLLVFFFWLFPFSYLVFKQKQIIKELKVIKNMPIKGVLSRPLPIDAVTQAYEECLEVLLNETFLHQNQYEGNQTELIEAYTLWAHQIKTPIAALDLLLQTEADSPKIRLMKIELFKIEQYVELTLHIARLDSFATDYVFSRVDMDEAVRTAVRKYRTLFIEKGIQFESIGDGLPIATDLKWLGVILDQLISNSVKYTPKGKVTAEISGLSLTIRDTGVGIQPEDMPRVFEKGYTGYNGRMDQKATGIGLYVVKRTCDRLGIKLSLSSELGLGTEVTLTFQPYKDVRLASEM